LAVVIANVSAVRETGHEEQRDNPDDPRRDDDMHRPSVLSKYQDGSYGNRAKDRTFANPSVRVNPQDDDELLIALDVRNGGDKTITKLHVWVDFYNRNGLKAADEGELLAHDFGLGDNSSPVLPRSSKRAIVELDSPENWTGGKMVITIDGLEIE